MRLHVDRHGSGRDLVLVHGWGLHSAAWRSVLLPLSARFRVHAVDLPGHGGSHAIQARTFEDAVGMLDEALPGDAMVCGWSLGALLALALAHRMPRRIRALALVGATPCFVERPGWAHGMAHATFDAFAAGLERDADATLATFMRLAALNAVRGRQAAHALSMGLRDPSAPDLETLRATLAWLRDVDLRPMAAQLTLPAIVVHGDTDAVTAPAAGQWLADHIPNARFASVPGGAHIPFITHPEDFAAALESADG